MNTHLDSEDAHLNYQQGKQAASFAAFTNTDIVCADFNEPFIGPVHQNFYDKGYKTSACISNYNHLTIDGVVVRNNSYPFLSCASLKMPSRSLSDHDPFLATLATRPERS